MAGVAEPQIWTNDRSEKRSRVQAMFSEIAPSYDLLNGVMSLSLHHRWRAFAVRTLRLKTGDQVGDLCCGTGDFIVPLRRAVGGEGQVVGFDFAAPMLEFASRKYSSDASFILADALALPVSSDKFDGVTIGWGLRNLTDIDSAHHEIYRVLRSGGRFASLDMARARNRTLRTVSEFLFNKVVPMLGKAFGHGPAYRYLPQSTENFATRDELQDSMLRAGFVDVGYRDLMFGNICVHWGAKA